MNTNSKKYKVRILDCEYTVVSDESQEHVIQAAKSVDDLMRSIASKAPSSTIERTAVLTALCIASELLQIKSQLTEYKNSEQQLNKLIDQELL